MTGSVVTVAYDRHQAERMERFARQLALNVRPFEDLYTEMDPGPGRDAR